MNSTKIIAIALPIAAGLALAGTGFGAWVFSNNVSAANQGASINITAAINVDGLKVVFDDEYTTLDASGKSIAHTGGNKLVLDQFHDADMTVAYHFEVTANQVNGLKMMVNNSISDYQTYAEQNSVSYSGSNMGLDTGKVYKIRYSAAYNFELDGGAATYLSVPFSEDQTIGIDTAAYFTYSYDDTSDSWKISAPELTNIKTTQFQWNSTAQHVNSGNHQAHSENGTAKPECMKEYNDMVTAIGDDDTGIVLNLSSFQVYDVECFDAKTLSVTAPNECDATYSVNGADPVLVKAGETATMHVIEKDHVLFNLTDSDYEMLLSITKKTATLVDDGGSYDVTTGFEIPEDFTSFVITLFADAVSA